MVEREWPNQPQGCVGPPCGCRDSGGTTTQHRALSILKSRAKLTEHGGLLKTHQGEGMESFFMRPPMWTNLGLVHISPSPFDRQHTPYKARRGFVHDSDSQTMVSPSPPKITGGLQPAAGCSCLREALMTRPPRPAPSYPRLQAK